MHTLYLYLDFDKKPNTSIKLIELLFLHNNQYMGPYIFTHIVFNTKKMTNPQTYTIRTFPITNPI
jgi:hypothetical protein